MKKKHIIALLIILLSLFAVPFLFWFKIGYYVGGDDTMLYYLFPWEMTKNYVFSIISNNGLSSLGGYAAQSYQFPFFLLLAGAKSFLPFINTQHLFYGFTLASGFLFFYLFMGIFIKNDKYDFHIKVLSSFLYSFSIFFFYSLWSGLFVLYLIPVFPLTAYLFFKGVIENKIHFIFFAAMILSLFSILIFSVPWFSMALLAIVPPTFFILQRFKKRVLLFGTILIVLIILYNFYWIIHFLYPYANPVASENGKFISLLSSSDYITGAENLIKAVTGSNNLIYPVFNLFHKDIQIAYGWQNYKIFSSWHEKFLLPNLLFILVIVGAGALLGKTTPSLRKLYALSLISWLIIVYFFTIKLGDSFGLAIFLFLNRHIPGFVMFRNAYGKIAPAFPLSYALVVSVSLKIIADQIKKPILVWSFLTLLTIITILDAKPFILNEYFSIPIWTTKQTYSSISNFNSDFYSLSRELNRLNDDSNIAWFPMTLFGYVLIQDEEQIDHYYSGLSPLTFLAKKTDIPGLSTIPAEVGSNYRQALFDKKYHQIGLYLRELHVGYIIVNKNISQELQKSYLFSINKSGDLYDVQNNALLQEIVGKKIKSFGKRYDLYDIKNIYKSDKIFLTTNESQLQRKNSSFISYQRNTNYQYTLQLKNIKNKQELIFLDPFNPYWKLLIGKNKLALPQSEHRKTFDYANGFTIDPVSIKNKLDKNLYSVNKDGSIDLTLTLYFIPQLASAVGFIVSGLSIIITVCYLIFLGIINSQTRFKMTKPLSQMQSKLYRV